MSHRASLVDSRRSRDRRATDPGDGWLGRRLTALLAPAGIVLDGPNPWDPRVRRSRAIRRIMAGGTLGAGESYMDGDWDCAALDELTARLLAIDADQPLARRAPAALRDSVLAWLRNRQSRARARADIQAHYDIGNTFYRAMLGETMTYSCAYWRDADTLDDAQKAKHELICQKLGLERGMRVLDIGCGWGGFADHAARRHDVEVVGITLSPSQAEYARARTAGLPVDIRLTDYRDVTGRFDRVVSIGMFEHVGPANYRRYFESVSRLMATDGLFLLHTIGGRYSETTADPWMARYVFPGSVLPSPAQIARAIEGLFVLEDWHNFGADYDRTLMAWHHNVEAAWPTLAEAMSDRQHRLWTYYLLTCAGTFRARRNHLWQLVLSPRGVRGGYRRAA